MGREFELKYTATPEIHQAILDTYGQFQRFQMETTYFDTPDGAFSARKMTLRIRKENDLTVCTLKVPLPGGAKGEWECAAENMQTGLAQLVSKGAPAEVASLAKPGLVPVCGARFTRLATILPTADGTAELALDRGILLGGGREMPLWELEVELKSGSDEATIALASQLAATYGLSAEPQSKFRRALGLAKGE